MDVASLIAFSALLVAILTLVGRAVWLVSGLKSDMTSLVMAIKQHVQTCNVNVDRQDSIISRHQAMLENHERRIGILERHDESENHEKRISDLEN
jgi:hypothetical protein